MLIHAYQVLVVKMQDAMYMAIHILVPVYQTTSALLQIVDQNVRSRLIVLVIRHVFEIVALIHVPAHAELMLNVMSEIMYQFALVIKDILEMPSRTAIQFHHKFKMKFLKIDVIHLLAPQMLNVIMAFVRVCLAYKVIHTQYVGQNVF